MGRYVVQFVGCEGQETGVEVDADSASGARKAALARRSADETHAIFGVTRIDVPAPARDSWLVANPWTVRLGALVLAACLASWAIGRVLHWFGARHSGTHALAEVLVLVAVGAGVMVARRGR